MLVKKPSISNIKAELKKALEFHQAGQLAAAEGLYLNIIEHDPEHSDALHLLKARVFSRWGRNYLVLH